VCHIKHRRVALREEGYEGLVKARR
jgi:hypothetical protein